MARTGYVGHEKWSRRGSKPRLVADAAVGTLPRQATAFVLLARNLEVFLFPQAVIPLEVPLPPCPDERLVSSLAAVTWILLAPATQFLDQPPILVRLTPPITLRRARLPQPAADPALREGLRPQATADHLHGPAPSLGGSPVWAGGPSRRIRLKNLASLAFQADQTWAQGLLARSSHIPRHQSSERGRFPEKPGSTRHYRVNPAMRSKRFTSRGGRNSVAKDVRSLPMCGVLPWAFIASSSL